MGLMGSLNYTFDVITDKGSARLNEDAYAINARANLFAIFDGASSLTPFTDKDGKTGAFLAANIAKEVFEKGDKNLEALAVETNSNIREAMLKAGIDISDKLNLWATGLAAIKINEGYFDWIQVSDTLILVQYTDGTYKLLAKDYDHDKEILMLMKDLGEKGAENPRASVAPNLEQLRRHLNITYGVIAGENEIKFLNTGKESLKKVKTILLFSDGLLIPKSDLNKEDDIETLVREYGKGGLQGWLKYIRAIERNDPKLSTYPRYK